MPTFKNAKELVDAIATFQGYSFAHLKTETELKINKKSRIDKTPAETVFGGPIMNIANRDVGIGYVYSVSVNNRLEKEDKEPDFIPQSLPWGQWYNGSKIIIQHGEKFYLRVTYNTTHKVDKTLTVNGKPLTEEQQKKLSEFTSPPSDKPSNQGLDNPVVVQTICIDNITSLKFNGDEWIKA